MHGWIVIANRRLGRRKRYRDDIRRPFYPKIKQIFSVNIESGKVLFRMAATDLDGNTELHWHAYKGDVEGINLALKRVPEYLNFKNNKGKTPLDIAEECQQVQAITLLRKHGARLASET
jgi:ankyrin repeat protein